MTDRYDDDAHNRQLVDELNWERYGPGPQHERDRLAVIRDADRGGPDTPAAIARRRRELDTALRGGRGRRSAA